MPKPRGRRYLQITASILSAFKRANRFIHLCSFPKLKITKDEELGGGKVPDLLLSQDILHSFYSVFLNL